MVFASLVPALALAALAATPNEAEACSPDICYDSNRFTELSLTHAEVKPEGVLVFHVRRQSGPLPLGEALAYVQVQVRDPMGEAVPGALEVFADDVVLWRPEAPLSPNTDYAVDVLVDNDTLGVDHDPEWVFSKECGLNIELQTTVSSTSGAFTPLDFLADSTEEVDHYGVISLETLVCCDGAMPREEYLCGTIPDLWWDEGFCTPDTQQGILTASFGVVPTVSGAGGDTENLVVRLHTDGEVRTAQPGELSISRSDDQPFCSAIELINLATGESLTSSEVCVGDDVADELGLLPLDPAAELAAQCEGEPYVCELDGEMWDPNACVPWTEPDTGDESGGGSGDAGSDGGNGDSDGSGGVDDGGSGDGGLDDDGISDRGCSCRADTDAGRWGSLWALIGLLALRRTRRRR